MNIKNFIKGIIIGIAKIIPGLSGAVLMISFNLYEKAIDAITNFFDNPKKNFNFLLNLGIGVIIGIVLFSKVISFLIYNYYFYTTCFFIGLIFGGIPVLSKEIVKKKINYFLIILSFGVMLLIGVLGINNIYTPQNSYLDFFIYFLAGIVEAIGTIIPGISSTALLMLMGVYESYISSISNFLNPSYLFSTIGFLFPFSIGLIVGIVGITLLVNYLFKNYKEKTFAVILGIALSSVFLLLVKLVPYITSWYLFLIGVGLFIIGYVITSKI